MKKIIYAVFFILGSLMTNAQCLRIESILADACTNNSTCNPSLGLYCGCEGAQEMVRLKVGSLPISISNITFNWPSNPWKGISSITATTTAITNSLQSTILGCGVLIQPPAGIIPSNSRVLFILSTEFCVGTNSFANLNDTFFLIFQNPGNTGGHFANANSTTSLTPRVTSYTVSGVPACAGSVSYVPASLTSTAGVAYSVSGAYSSNKYDGGAIEYDALGNATYVNRLCQAPFQPLSIAASPSITSCAGSSIVLTSTVTGAYSSVTWSGGSGTFSSPSSLTTSYTPSAGELGTTISLTCTATKTCATSTSTASTTTSIKYLQAPLAITINSTNGYSLCALGSSVLSYSISNASATGTVSSAWSSPSASTPTYAVSGSAGASPITYTLNVSNICGVKTQTVNIYPLANPSVTISVPSLTACVGSTVGVVATSNSGNYNWTNPSGATTASVVITANTTTTGIVTTTNTCGTKTDSYTLTVIPQSTVNVSPTAVSICTGQSEMVTASANTAVTYTWSGTGVNGLNTNTVSLNTAGTYTVASSSVCNTSTAQVNVVVNSTPTLSVATTNTLLCGGATATLSLAGSVGSYSWSTGATTPTIAVSLGGTYSATVTTATCGFTNSAITISTLPTPTLSVNSNSVTICAGQSAILTANSNITPYQWSTGATTNTISVSPIVNTSYTVGVSNTCGSPTQTVDVSISALPNLSINTQSLTICNGAAETLTLSGSSGTYAWGGSLATTQTLSISAGGVYSATVNAGVCGTATASIAIANILKPTLSVTSNTSIICDNTPIILTATSTYTNNYSWSPLAASTNTLQVLTPLVYTVTSTNSCGSAMQTITVTIGSTPVLTVTPTSTVICAGNTVSISATGGSGNYNWTGVSSTSSVVVVSSGTYIVSNTNACGTGSQTVIVNTSTVSAGLNGTPTSGTSPLSVLFSNLSSGATTYTWNYGNGTSSNGVFPVSQTYTTAGIYTVVLSVTNSDGCENSQSILITVKNEDATLIVPNVFTPNNDSINDLFYVKATNIADFNCVIFDRWGLQFYSWSDLKGGWDGKNAGKDATDGTYFYIINATDLNGKDVKRQGSFLLIR